MERQESINDVVRRLVDFYQPEKIYLFGSTARGEDRPDSDLDFLVVVPDDQPSDRFWGVYQKLCGIGISVDVVAFRHKDFEARRGWLMSLPAIALREGKVLYDAQAKAA